MIVIYYIILFIIINRNVHGFFYSIGNQYEQYEKYKKDIDINIKETLFNLADECFNVDIADFHKCSNKNIVKLRQLYHPLWNGIVDLNALHNALNQSIIDCNYNITDYNEYKVYDSKIDILFEKYNLNANLYISI